VNDETSQEGASHIGNPPVPKEQIFEMAEFGERDIGGKCGLHALFPDYTDADVGGLDHADIIATVTNAQNCLFLIFVLFNTLDYHSLLLWRASIANESV
jgi:hypothetical protein